MKTSRWIILQWEVFYNKLVDKTKTQIVYLITLFRKSFRLWENVEKYNGAREVTNDNTIRRICVACWIRKATRAYAQTRTRAQTPANARKHTHPRSRAHTEKYLILFAFPLQQWFGKPVLILRYMYIGNHFIVLKCSWLGLVSNSKKKIPFSSVTETNNSFYRQKMSVIHWYIWMCNRKK